MDNDNNFRNLISFQDSLFIPQHNTVDEHAAFIDKISLIVKSRKDKKRALLYTSNTVS